MSTDLELSIGQRVRVPHTTIHRDHRRNDAQGATADLMPVEKRAADGTER